MRVLVAAVGKAKGGLAPSILEYETRVRRYYSFDSLEVKDEPSRSAATDRIRREEGHRLLARVPSGLEVVALHRDGHAWTSERLALYLTELGVNGQPGVAFLVGGAFGLSDEVLAAARHRLSLSAFTLPHELARLVITEQLYRAGTIARGEPYHKARTTG